MNSHFGPWTTAIHDHGNAQLATFWKRRFHALASVSDPRPTGRMRGASVLTMAVLLALLPTFLSVSAEADEDSAITDKKSPVDQQEAAPASVSAGPGAKETRESEESLQRRSRLNLQKIARAMHVYHDEDSLLPAAANISPGASHPVSWRVLLLPYLGEEKLYSQYRRDEPWNSEHNRTLIEQIPDVYVTPTHKPLPKGHTSYVVPVGAMTLFPAGDSRGVRDCRDGVANTLLVVEVDVNHSVPWTRPKDLVVDDTAPYKGLIGHRSGAFLAAFGDGSTAIIPELLRTSAGIRLGVEQSSEMLRRLFNLDDGLPTRSLEIDQQHLR